MSQQYWTKERLTQLDKPLHLTPTENSLIKLSNKSQQPNSKLISHILKLRDNFQIKNKLNRTPHPLKTHNVIYVMFNLTKAGPQALYVGKTRNNALTRRRTHIACSHTVKLQKLPIYRFLAKLTPDQIGILPLMSVPNYHSYSHYYERYWIHALQTHKKPKAWYQPLNCSIEHTTYLKKAQKGSNPN